MSHEQCLTTGDELGSEERVHCKKQEIELGEGNHLV